MERGSGVAVARGDGAIDVAREKRALRQKRRLAGIFRTFLFCVPPRAGTGERQLAAGARIRWAASGRSSVEQFALCGVPLAGKADRLGERAGTGSSIGGRFE